MLLVRGNLYNTTAYFILIHDTNLSCRSFEIRKGISKNPKIIIGLDSISNQHLIYFAPFGKVQVGNDQEMVQSERNSHSINRGVAKN